jgi:Tol biopolymer transport system component
MRSRLVDGSWQEPDTASFSGIWFDVDPFVAPDGTRLYFSSSRPVAPEDTLLDFNTWVVLLSSRGEDEPALMPKPVNSDSVDIFVSATLSGALYFSSNRDGVRRTYRASTGGTDATVEIVPIDMNLEAGVGNPAISANEKHIVFSVKHEGGIGAADLYVSARTVSGWSPARLLPEPINSTFTEFAPSWSADGKYLYFTSERPGIVGPVAEGVRPPGDIYRVPAEAILTP